MLFALDPEDKVTVNGLISNLVPIMVRMPRGAHVKIFDRDARPIFLGLKSGQILFFWVGKFFSYFSGLCKVSAIFWGLTNFQLLFWAFQFLYHTLESFE